jgi:hypothetical protein
VSTNKYDSYDTPGLGGKNPQALLQMKVQDPKSANLELRNTVPISKSIHERQGIYQYDLFYSDFINMYSFSVQYLILI